MLLNKASDSMGLAGNGLQGHKQAVTSQACKGIRGMVLLFACDGRAAIAAAPQVSLRVASLLAQNACRRSLARAPVSCLLCCGPSFALWFRGQRSGDNYCENLYTVLVGSAISTSLLSSSQNLPLTHGISMHTNEIKSCALQRRAHAPACCID